MRNFRNSLLVTLFGLFISMSVWASTNYAPLIEDIEQRLDKTAELYQQQHADEARRTVQMAYFEVFENLEGPIRINISARKSYEMESAFGEIRRMIGEKKPLADVQARIDWLKAALREVEPVLDGGHLVTLLVEAIRRKPLNPAQIRYTQMVGLGLLILLMLLATFKDLTRLNVF